MSETLATLEAAMRADADALRIIGQNIANAEVTAYRRQVPVQVAQFDQVVESVTRAQGAEAALAPQTATVLDPRLGTMRPTGEALHLAIEGSGFFALKSPDGTLFTRRGDLHVGADGVLMSASGHAVLGQGGSIHVGSAIPTIEADGSVRVGNDVIDQLQLAHFADTAQLQYLGNGLYASPDGVAAAQSGQSSVRQGALEASNVTPVTEMVQLMETMRHFEAAQRLVRGQDELLEKAISELGRIR